jgi:hypothetical protein
MIFKVFTFMFEGVFMMENKRDCVPTQKEVAEFEGFLDVNIPQQYDWIEYMLWRRWMIFGAIVRKTRTIIILSTCSGAAG